MQSNPPGERVFSLKKKSAMSVCEMSLLLCLGASWPVSIAKSLRIWGVAGNSPAFTAVIGFGYPSGVTINQWQ